MYKNWTNRKVKHKNNYYTPYLYLNRSKGRDDEDNKIENRNGNTQE